jgi:hypothetical protein
MAGAHEEREALAARTGMTGYERDRLIASLDRKGWSQTRIAGYVGLTQSGVHRALRRLAGKPRSVSVGLDMCEGCWGDVRKDQLNHDGLCPQCR